jgi:hypothetical protein
MTKSCSGKLVNQQSPYRFGESLYVTGGDGHKWFSVQHWVAAQKNQRRLSSGVESANVLALSGGEGDLSVAAKS